MSGVQHLTVDAEGQDQRLDRWFRKQFPHIPQGRIEKMCRKGEIRVEGGRVKPATRLEQGQSVRIPPLPENEAPAPERDQISDTDARMIRDTVMFRDDHLIVLNKPAGLAVQGGTGMAEKHVDALAEALRFDYPDKPKLVHRLDKDTSGVLLLARTGRAAAALTKALQSKATRKIYWAAVAGAPDQEMGTIRFGLVKQAGHGPHGAGEKMVCIHPSRVDATPGAKRAVTDFAVIESAGKRTCWVALVPVTGRTHQLRAHMAEIGCPIVGDGKYGTNRQTNEGDGWGAQLGGEISRKLHLHARSISFDHPITGKRMVFEAPMPPHMKKTWETLGWSERDATFDPFEEEDV